MMGLIDIRTIDPLKEVCVTVGASEAIFLACQSLVEPGDEVGYIYIFIYISITYRWMEYLGHLCGTCIRYIFRCCNLRWRYT